ncbi:MAG: tRNA pseudouridine(38-40) synthase TruA [Elusimicrobia bacterium]|nr:tRNA pseudouridine(38-40) synthase TruA [Elusimicrobiota bacterium]
MPPLTEQRNIKLVLEYDGGRYSGWQRQNRKEKAKGEKTVERSVSAALRRLFGREARLTGAGRTDAGVHARGQVANFRISSKLSCDRIQHALNAFLPGDISVLSVEDVPGAFHSRFSAKSKHYRYSILNRRAPPALLRGKVHHCSYKLDVDLMRREARELRGRHDFRAFQNAGSPRKGGTVRNMFSVEVKLDRADGIISIDMKADGFLYNMARNIAGTLIDIGRGRLPAGSTAGILESQDRRFAGQSAPACGLCLVEVKY